MRTDWFVAAVGAAALAGVLVLVIRYVQADRETRRSIRQAWLIRWRWHRLSRMLGLVVVDPTPRLLLGLLGGREREGKSLRPRVLVPRICVRADEYGVRVTARTLPKVGRAEWVKVADHLANAWGCVRVAVMQPEPGALSIRAVRRDPLTEPFADVPSGLDPGDVDKWEIGRDEYAEPVGVRISNVPGVSIAGLPGYGKTSLLNRFIASLAPSPAVQLAVVDGKGGADYEDLAVRFFAMCGDDLVQANRLFQRVNEVRRRRSQVIRYVLGVKNMWHVGASPSWPLVVLVIDEAHTFFAEVKGDKKLMALAAENRRLVEELVKKGRNVGIVTLLATQKSTGDAIPTAIRDVCPVALSFAQRTDEAAVAALGADIRQYPDANPVALQDPTYVGVASMVVQGRPGFVRVRTPYVSDEDVARICARSADRVRDPGVLLETAIRPRVALLASSGAAPARGEDRSEGAAAGEVEDPRELLADRHGSFKQAPVEGVEGQRAGMEAQADAA